MITEVTVRLYPLPEAVSAAICSFPSIEAAVRTTIQIIQLGVPIARVRAARRATRCAWSTRHDKLGLREEPMLLMEFHGSPGRRRRSRRETVQEIASEHGGNAFEWATTPEERTRLWTARHNAYFAGHADRSPAAAPITTDTCVPISRLADCLLDAVGGSRRQRPAATSSSATSATATSTSRYLLDPTSPRSARPPSSSTTQLVQRALALDGTCTGEHGVGLHKMELPGRARPAPARST